jgi:hypothetical protein
VLSVLQLIRINAKAIAKNSAAENFVSFFFTMRSFRFMMSMALLFLETNKLYAKKKAALEEETSI